MAHLDAIYDIDAQINGRLLSTCSNDKKIKIWKFDEIQYQIDEENVITLRGHKSIIYKARFSVDQTLLASAGVCSGIKLWDLSTQQEKASFLGNDCQIQEIVMPVEQNSIFFLQDWKLLGLIDTRVGKEVLGIRLSPGDQIKTFETLNSQKILSYQQMIKNSLKLSTAFSMNLNDVYIGSQKGALYKFDIRSPEQCSETYQISNSEITAIRSDPSGGSLAVGDYEGDLKVFDLVSM